MDLPDGLKWCLLIRNRSSKVERFAGSYPDADTARAAMHAWNTSTAKQSGDEAVDVVPDWENFKAPDEP